MPTVGQIFGGYSAFLCTTGWYGAASHGYSAASLHSLYAGLGGGTLMAVCAAFSWAAKAPEKGEATYKIWMIAVHVGLLFNALFAAVFATQAARTFGVPEKRPQHRLFTVMLAGSVVTLAALYKAKPKKKKDKK